MNKQLIFYLQQQDMDDDSPKTHNSNLGEDNDITSPREYGKLLKEENESLKTLIHQQIKKWKI